MEIPKFFPKKAKREPQETTEGRLFSQRVEKEVDLDPATALKEERTLLGKLRGRSREVAKVLILMSALIAGEGTISTARAEERPSTLITQVERERQKDLSVREFIKLSNEQQNLFLRTLAVQPPEYKVVKEMMGEHEFTSKELVTESGIQRITQLKEQLEKLYDEEPDPQNKKKINQAFLAVHRFTLEYGIDSFGKQALGVYDINSEEAMTMNVSELIMRERDGKPIYDKNETDKFLEDGKQGPLLATFIEKIKDVSGSELSRIKQIYDIVAYEIPRYEWYHGEGEIGKHGYQTFEQLLKKQAGICTEKNALLVYALKQNGFDAYLWGFSGHIYTRVFTSEGTLEIDVTNSNPLVLTKLATQGEYCYVTDGVGVKKMPNNLQQYAKKWDEGDDYRVFIPLNSDEAVEYVVSQTGISAEKLREILSKIADVKPHPLYEISKKGTGEITPKNSGQYLKDLFKKQIRYE